MTNKIAFNLWSLTKDYFAIILPDARYIVTFVTYGGESCTFWYNCKTEDAYVRFKNFFYDDVSDMHQVLQLREAKGIINNKGFIFTRTSDFKVLVEIVNQLPNYMDEDTRECNISFDLSIEKWFYK